MKLADRHYRVCAIVAGVMTVVAVGYVALALAARDTAKSIWWAYAIVEACLAIWNLLVYRAKARARAERRRHRVKP